MSRSFGSMVNTEALSVVSTKSFSPMGPGSFLTLLSLQDSFCLLQPAHTHTEIFDGQALTVWKPCSWAWPWTVWTYASEMSNCSNEAMAWFKYLYFFHCPILSWTIGLPVSAFVSAPMISIKAPVTALDSEPINPDDLLVLEHSWHLAEALVWSNQALDE